jgi:protein-S-isoprenylcysteine O-methyltransferase Ste14
LPVLGIFWIVTLGLAPILILRLQQAAGLDDLFFTIQTGLGLGVLAAGTALVLWSVLTFAIAGEGTPISFDAPRRLVISGPYAWLRNPMVLGFIVQGVGVGLMSGSFPVMLFYLLMGLWWNFLVRPRDEDQLQKVFGRDLELYRRHVPCWLPLRRRWSPPPLTRPISLDELPERRHSRKRR